MAFIAKKCDVFTLGEVLKFQSPSKLLESLEGESLKNRMTFWQKKCDAFTVGEVLKFERPFNLLYSLRGESLKNRMTSEAEKAKNFYLRRGFEVPESIQAVGHKEGEYLKIR